MSVGEVLRIEPNQGQNTSPWAWHGWTPGLVLVLIKVNNPDIIKYIAWMQTFTNCTPIIFPRTQDLWGGNLNFRNKGASNLELKILLAFSQELQHE